MVYHPDMNKDNAEAADKFRELTEAYEVLGNHRLRKLYDKGIIHTAGDKYQERDAPTQEEEDARDPQARFYRARMHKDKATATGSTPIYDFDAWTNSHYGSEFVRQQKLKHNTEKRKKEKDYVKLNMESEMMLLPVLLLFLIMFLIKQETFDVDHTKSKKKEKEKDDE